MTLTQAEAAAIVDAAAAGIVLLGIGLAITRSITRSIVLLALQSFLLGTAGIAVGLSTGEAQLVLGGLFAIAVKTVVVPLMLAGVVRSVPVRVERNALLGRRWSAFVAVAIVFVAAVTVDGAAFTGSLGANRALPAAVAEVLTGLFIVITRRKSVSVAIGLLVFENGLALVAFALTYGMPLVVELGVAFDLLIVMIVVRVHARALVEMFGSLSTERLRNLRG